MLKIFESKATKGNLINAFFPVCMVLNQQSRPDRMQQFMQEAKRHDLKYEVFYSIPHPRSFTSFNLSVYAMLAKFYATGEDRMLMLEDDCVLSDNALDQFEKSVRELPPTWEMLYLGCNIIENNARPYSANLAKTTGAWTTHAVGIRRSVAEAVLKAGIDPGNGMMDDWFAKKIHPKGQSYVCKPMIAVQRPGYSDLWQRDTNYTDIFRNANNKLG
jgi:hypothetical protein